MTNGGPTIAHTDVSELVMHVNAGSKVSNLVPYATNVFKRDNCRMIVWRGFTGGVAKAVACAELFKQAILSSPNQALLDPLASPELERKKPPVQPLYQLTEISTNKRNCVDQDARVTYIMEEPTIRISLSKDPISSESFVQLVTSETSSTSCHVQPSPKPSSPLQKPLSRRQLKHLKKRKRDIIKGPSAKKSKATASQLELGPFSPPPTDYPPVEHQCQRFEPALLAVSKAMKKMKKRKKP